MHLRASTMVASHQKLFKVIAFNAFNANSLMTKGFLQKL
jgi:hypothetical protein